jgi:hypothetical protein
LTTNILSTLSTSGLTNTSHPYLALNRLHCSLLIASLTDNPSRLDEAISVSAACASALRALLPEGHPVRGVAVAELGKLLTVDEPEQTQCPPEAGAQESGKRFPPTGVCRLRLAHDTLVRALMELEIGYGGEESELVQGVRKTSREVDKEISVWNRAVQNAMQ